MRSKHDEQPASRDAVSYCCCHTKFCVTVTHCCWCTDTDICKNIQNELNMSIWVKNATNAIYMWVYWADYVAANGCTFAPMPDLCVCGAAFSRHPVGAWCSRGTGEVEADRPAVKRPLINIQMCAVSDMLLGSTIHLSEESHISCVVVVVVEAVVECKQMTSPGSLQNLWVCWWWLFDWVW